MIKTSTLRAAAPALALLGLLAGLLTWQSASRSAIPVTQIDSGAQPLRQAFNRDSGRVRLLLLLDPT
jgi:hypothetical protein